MARIGQAALPANPKLLKEIAKATGGEAYQAGEEAELRDRFHAILDDLDQSELDDQAAWARSRDLVPDLMPWVGWLLLVGLGLRSVAPVRV